MNFKFQVDRVFFKCYKKIVFQVPRGIIGNPVRAIGSKPGAVPPL